MILLFLIEKVINRMMYLKNCGLLTCKGQELSVQESLQQKIALMNSTKPIRPTHNHMQKKSQQKLNEKEVFSFKLNGFRNYGDSDKIQQNIHQNNDNLKKQSNVKLQYFRSNEKRSLKTSCVELSKQTKTKCLYQPQYLHPQINVFKNHEHEMKSPKSFNQSSLLHCAQPKITFKLLENPSFDQNISLNKNCKDCELSSKISEWNNGVNLVKQADLSNIGQTSQSISTVQVQKLQKCSSSSSMPSLISNNSIHTWKLNDNPNATFKQIQKCQPKYFFENIKTIKTIQTTSQFKQNSRLNSAQNFANQTFEDEEGDSQNQSKIKTQKNFMKKKKKTAFFGCVQQQNEVKCLKQKPIQERSIENQSVQQNENKNKKVHFLFQSQFQDESQFQSASFMDTKQNRPTTKYKNYQSKCSPSLNSIVQFAALTSVEVKQTPINSIKQMTFHRSPQQSSPKWKYVNTIKSIGGDSMYSQNSYLDLKFMQSLQSRRALLKLV